METNTRLDVENRNLLREIQEGEEKRKIAEDELLAMKTEFVLNLLRPTNRRLKALSLAYLLMETECWYTCLFPLSDHCFLRTISFKALRVAAPSLINSFFGRVAL